MTETEPQHWHEAVRAVKHNSSSLQLMLERDPGLLRASDAGRTLLHHAASAARLEAIETLVALGADPNARNEEHFYDSPGSRPLHCLSAAPVPLKSVHVEACIAALQAGPAGADINACNASGDTPLHLAVLNGEHRAEAFLARGADVNARNNNGSTPLHLAASCSRAIAVQVLLEAGANPVARDDKGRTPLHGAAIAAESESDWKIMLGLTQAGADVNARDADGATALHLAAAADNESAVLFLLDQGANPVARDDKGRLPIDYEPPREIPRILRSAAEKWHAPESHDSESPAP